VYTFRGWAIDEEVPYLDVAAALAPDGRTLVLCVVNRHADTAVEAELRLPGMRPATTCLAETVDGPDVVAYNTWEQPDCVGVTRAEWAADATRPHYRFAPHSLAMLTIPLG
jgi:alpha-L-arabinofuranosidase